MPIPDTTHTPQAPVSTACAELLSHLPGGKSPATDARPRQEKRFFLVEYTWAFILFALLYVLPGIVGHEPWKQDETYIVEIVRSMVDTGDFVVPTMAGEPFMEKPPLFYWVAGGLAKLLSPLLSFHDAARLATAFFILLTCAAVAWAGRQWRDRDFGRTAVLVLLGCIGMQVYAHLMLTDIALLAGFAIGIAGLPGWQARPWRSGVQVGTGIGIAFLAKGLLGPGVFAVSAALLPLLFRHWRRRAYPHVALAAFLAALPWLLVWPTFLYLRSPELFSDWFWLNNIGRFLGFAVPTLGAANDEGFWAKNLVWVTLPAAPLALLTLWRTRRAIGGNEMVQVAGTFAAVMLGVLLLSASARGGYALPLLVPLSLLGAASVGTLSPAAETLWRRSAQVFFGVLALLLWFGWAWTMWHGDASALPVLRNQFAPDPDLHLHAIAFGFSLLASLLAAWLMWHPGRPPALQTWVVGIALCWCLLANLFMPWVDQVKSYKATFESLTAALPAHVDCVTSYGLGESERSMLSYYHGIVTERLEDAAAGECRVLLVEGLRDKPQVVDERVWHKIWEGARPADDRERFWLYERATVGLSAR